MVTVLPIMLQHLCSARVWTWFTDKAKAETSGWIYDETEGCIVSPDKNYTSEILDDSDWDDKSIEKTEEEILIRPTTFKMNLEQSSTIKPLQQQRYQQDLICSIVQIQGGRPGLEKNRNSVRH
jgi:hypothetical protein